MQGYQGFTVGYLPRGFCYNPTLV